MRDTKPINRRRFLQLGAGAIGGAAASACLPGLIRQALAIAPNNPTGHPSLTDIEHVVIFMQENRAFDHYFGSLPGVRGYGDPRPMPQPSGQYVWYQPEGTHPDSRGFCDNVPDDKWLDTASWYQSDLAVQARDYVLPFRLNQPGDVQFQYLKDLDHEWKQSQDLWSNWNAWVPLKSREAMGFLDADDLPFYYRLAQAFTICDNYHASLFGPTNPNRIYLFSGNCDRPFNLPPSIGGGGADIRNDVNTVLTPAMYGQSAAARAATIAAGLPDWKTFAETLTDHGITWKVYQEQDNFDGDALQFFKNFRIDNHGLPINESSDPYFKTLYLRGRVFATGGGAVGSAVLDEFARDVAAGPEPDDPPLGNVKPGLPRVSWIVPPWELSEHPSNAPGHGAKFTAALLRTLILDHPDVFSKTVFLLMYDENDGFFDHVPSPVPPVTAAYGQMTLTTAGQWEVYDSVPKGLGPRVPMMIISPWTTGGRVDSQLGDHTSVLMFLERWLAAKELGRNGPPRCEPISAWRRSVCGDLTEAFDFARSGAPPRPDLATHFRNGNVEPAVPVPQSFPPQAPLVRPACTLPSACRVEARALAGGLALTLAGTGTVGATFLACWWPMSAAQKILQYTVEAGKTLDTVPIADRGAYDCTVQGPNGYLRAFRGAALGAAVPVVTTRTGDGHGGLLIELDNRGGGHSVRFLLSDNAYAENPPLREVVRAGEVRRIPWRTVAGWYDASVRIADDLVYFRRVAGCIAPAGSQATTDPAIGNRRRFKAMVSTYGNRYATLRFDYVTPPWSHHAGNWLGIFPIEGGPMRTNLLRRIAAPRGIGSVTLAGGKSGRLAAGAYEVWYFHGRGDAPIIAGGTPFQIVG
ncbi:MAG: phospholipase C, phosphocholine-specific [Rhodanobacteraceae bacterium]|nr:MAG: phospholipase C, phosphocholine-specific [Rhodanobacteraceae bacterium]